MTTLVLAFFFVVAPLFTLFALVMMEERDEKIAAEGKALPRAAYLGYALMGALLAPGFALVMLVAWLMLPSDEWDKVLGRKKRR